MSKLAILCIDDEKIVLDSLRDQLKNNFKDSVILEFAESASEGIEILNEFKEDGILVKVIISDWNMPGMTGDEFFLNIAVDFPDSKKILLSGEPDPNVIHKAKSKEFISILIQKPWDSKFLIGVVKDYLNE